MTKFNVGNEVKVIQNTSFIGGKETAGWHVSGQGTVKIGSIGIVESVASNLIEAKFKKKDVEDGARDFSRKLRFDEIELVESKPTKNQRITTLENEVAELRPLKQEVAELKLIVHELRGKKSIEPSTTNTVEDKPQMAKLVDGQWRPTNYEEIAEMMTLTPNQQRAAIIEKAKKFVEENSKGTDIVINDEYQVVTAIYYDGKDVYKESALCHPNDVYNEDIGKAIAVGRVKNMDVSEFEQAVQPTKVLASMQVQFYNYDGEDVGIAVVESVVEANYCHCGKWGSTHFEPNKTNDKIINDTNAIYEEGQ